MKTPVEIKAQIDEVMDEASWAMGGGDAHDLLDALDKTYASLADALALIQQLERERDEARNDLDTLNYANTELHSAYEAMKRERDAAVEQLTETSNEIGSCKGCVHYTNPGYKCYLWEANENCYEWRGVQEVQHGTE